MPQQMMLDDGQPVTLGSLDNTVVVLKPANIVQAAKADLERREHNISADNSDMRIYAFHRRHVAKAKGCTFTLIEFAVKEQSIGLESSKRNTRLIYHDIDLLRAALELVRVCPTLEEKA